MAYRPFRMPKDVPHDIARLLFRTSARKIPVAGQILSYENATLLYDLLAQFRKALQPTVTKAVRAMDKARTAPTRAKWSAIAQDAIHQAQRADAARIALDQAAGIEPLPPLASPDIVPRRTVVEPRDRQREAAQAEEWDYEDEDREAARDELLEPEEGAVEWEIGVDYTEDAGHAHAKGRTSDVSFNARIYRADRRPMTESDARDAIYQFTEQGEMPDAIVVRSVSWSNWKGKVRYGKAHDLENFRAILAAVGDHGLRLGGVKGDRL